MGTKRLLEVIAATAASVCVTAALGAGPASSQITARVNEPSHPDLANRVHDASSRSNDLRVQIVYSTELVMNDETDVNKGISTREVVPAADLVEEVRGSTDPLVLDLMVQRCPQPLPKSDSRCDALAFARRWTDADTQNQVAWLTLASVQKTQGDLDGARSTFLRAAQASSWHDHFNELARVLIAAAPDAGSVRMRHAVLGNALGRASVFGLSNSAWEMLATFCKEGADVRTACAQIVATMFRDGTTLRSLMLAAPFARRAHVDPTVIAGYQQKADALSWSIRLRSEAPNGDVDPDTADDAALRADNRRLQAMFSTGERQTFEEELRARHVAEGDAAARYVRTLSPIQLEQRKAWLAAG